MYNAGMQYTIRDIPKDIDRALRKLAREEGKSLNRAIIDALRKAAGVGASEVHHDLDWAIGRWTENPGFDAAMAEQDQVNPEDWQ